MFIFNVKKGKTWRSTYQTSNIKVNSNTGNIVDRLIDFGYHSALQFKYDDSVQLTVRYTKSNDFENDPTNEDINIDDVDT